MNTDENFKLSNQKAFFMKIIGEVYEDFFTRNKLSSYPQLFLMFCSFMLYVEKIPNKAMNNLLKNKKKLYGFKSQITSAILAKKCRSFMEKKITNGSTSYKDNFALVIIYDEKVKEMERERERERERKKNDISIVYFFA